ncbi:hypothetical protein, partial [Salmonella sp. s29873]|uniref:hypothetical protein n=1 Tax=Salmonella sp. s29873 TaxID=3159634 RepID=UPI0039815D2B
LGRKKRAQKPWRKRGLYLHIFAAGLLTDQVLRANKNTPHSRMVIMKAIYFLFLQSVESGVLHPGANRNNHAVLLSVTCEKQRENFIFSQKTNHQPITKEIKKPDRLFHHDKRNKKRDRRGAK